MDSEKNQSALRCSIYPPQKKSKQKQRSVANPPDLVFLFIVLFYDIILVIFFSSGDSTLFYTRFCFISLLNAPLISASPVVVVGNFSSKFS